MSPEAQIELVQDPDGWRWTVQIGAEILAQSPTGVYWTTEEEARTAADVACRLMGELAGMADVSAVTGDESPDDEFEHAGPAEPLALALAVELISRGMLPPDWMEGRA